MTYYTLTQSDMQYFAYMVPKDIRWQIQKSGYYTIGALETGNFAAGVLQFYIGPTNKRNTFEATITYMYVDKNFRRSGVGTLLLMEMDRILEMVEEDLEMDETEETKEEQAANEEELQREKEQDNPPDDLNKAVVYRRPKNKSKKKK